MFWISPGCLSGWFRPTVRNGGRLRGHTPKNTASSPCRAGRILPDLGAFYGQNNGCGAGIFPVILCGGIGHQESPGRWKCLIWGQLSQLRGWLFAGVQRAAAFCAGYRGAAALLGSRGEAHWRVKGGSPYRVKGETPCPARVDACVNPYWVLPDASHRRFGSPAALPLAGKS